MYWLAVAGGVGGLGEAGRGGEGGEKDQPGFYSCVAIIDTLNSNQHKTLGSD